MSYFHRRNLPHFDPGDAPYFITFRLVDSLPRAVLVHLNGELRNALDRAQTLDATHRLDAEITARKQYFKHFDDYLDRCEDSPMWLKDDRVASAIGEHLRSLEEQGCFTLYASCIMPNHVHLLLGIDDKASLSTVMQRIKGGSSLICNRILGRTGAFWQSESYDHVVRKGEFSRIAEYLIENPVKAGLVTEWGLWPYTYLSKSLVPE